MLLKREPVLWQAFILGLINMLVVFDVVNFTDVQFGAINTALAGVLGFVVRQRVTPIADPRNADGKPAELVAKPAA